MPYTEATGWEDPILPEYFYPTALLLDRHIQAGLGSKIALTVDDEHYSYERLLDVVKDTVARLVAVGARPGERLFIFGRDSLEYIAYWLAAVRLGSVPVVVSDAYRGDDLLYFLSDSSARTLVIDGEQLAKLESIRDRLPDTLKAVVVRDVAGSVARLDALVGEGRIAFWHSDIPVAVGDREEQAETHRDDIAYMFYSGGTTGRAKGIPHLAGDFILVPERHGAFWSYAANDVVHATSKKYFTHGLWPGVLIPFYWAARSVISRRDATGENVIALLESHHPNKLVTVPTVVKNLIAHGQDQGVRVDLSFLQAVFTASEKLPLPIFQQFAELFGISLLDSIGSAEVPYEWIANRPEDSRAGSLGKPVYGYQIRLVDDQGRIVEQPGVRGQAEVYSATGAPFYWRKRDLSNRLIVNGWIRTGDELYFDEDGFYWFAARSNDVFKVKGLWVSPLEIEERLAADTRVREAAVVPYQDADGLTQPLAYLVLRNADTGGIDLEAELSGQIRQTLGGFKVPGRYIYVDTLPRTTLQKIDRRELRDRPFEQH